MSKYDCTKMTDFLHEFRRRCVYEHCDDCPYGDNCNNEFLKETRKLQLETIDYIQKWSDDIQKWSDENPEPHEKTILEDFKEKFPNVKTEIGEGLERFPVDIHPCDLYGDIFECSHECYQCWNRPLSEVEK